MSFELDTQTRFIVDEKNEYPYGFYFSATSDIFTFEYFDIENYGKSFPKNIIPAETVTDFLKKNCKFKWIFRTQRVDWSSDGIPRIYFGFENQTDALLFKLRFS